MHMYVEARSQPLWWCSSKVVHLAFFLWNGVSQWQRTGYRRLDKLAWKLQGFSMPVFPTLGLQTHTKHQPSPVFYMHPRNCKHFGNWAVSLVSWLAVNVISPWSSCLGPLQGNTQGPISAHPLIWRGGMSDRHTLLAVQASPSSTLVAPCVTVQWGLTWPLAHTLFLLGIWEVGSTAGGRHFRRGFHGNSNFLSSCSCSLSLYF